MIISEKIVKCLENIKKVVKKLILLVKISKNTPKSLIDLFGKLNYKF